MRAAWAWHPGRAEQPGLPGARPAPGPETRPAPGPETRPAACSARAVCAPMAGGLWLCQPLHPELAVPSVPGLLWPCTHELGPPVPLHSPGCVWLFGFRRKGEFHWTCRSQSCFPRPSVSPAGHMNTGWGQAEGLQLHLEPICWSPRAAGGVCRAVQGWAGKEVSAYLESACYWPCCSLFLQGII